MLLAHIATLYAVINILYIIVIQALEKFLTKWLKDTKQIKTFTILHKTLPISVHLVFDSCVGTVILG